MFEKTLQLIDEQEFKKIQEIKILLVGVGGVGGFVLEALVRFGFSNITIVDHDTFEKSNLNRQIIATQNNIGKLKVEEARKRCLEINEDIHLKTLSIFLNDDTIDLVFKEHFDYIIDACDTVLTKFLLIKTALNKNIKIISCMGTGNRFDPTKLCITTLNKTYNDPLSKAMRTILKKNHISLTFPVIWSSEIPIKVSNRKPASLIMVPGTAGMLIISYLIEDIKKTTN